MYVIQVIEPEVGNLYLVEVDYWVSEASFDNGDEPAHQNTHRMKLWSEKLIPGMNAEGLYVDTNGRTYTQADLEAIVAAGGEEPELDEKQVYTQKVDSNERMFAVLAKYATEVTEGKRVGDERDLDVETDISKVTAVMDEIWDKTEVAYENDGVPVGVISLRSI